MAIALRLNARCFKLNDGILIYTFCEGNILFVYAPHSLKFSVGKVFLLSTSGWVAV